MLVKRWRNINRETNLLPVPIISGHLFNRTSYLIQKVRGKELAGVNSTYRNAGVLGSCIKLGNQATLKALDQEIFVVIEKILP
jgi:hypothetical protein